MARIGRPILSVGAIRGDRLEKGVMFPAGLEQVGWLFHGPWGRAWSSYVHGMVPRVGRGVRGGDDASGEAVRRAVVTKEIGLV